MTKYSFSMIVMVLTAVSLLAWNQDVQAQSAEGREASLERPCTDINRFLGDWSITREGRPVSDVTFTANDPTNCSVMEVWKPAAGSGGGNSYWVIYAYGNATRDWALLAGGSNAATGTTAARILYKKGVLVNGRDFQLLAEDVDGSEQLVYTFTDDGRIREYSRTSTDGGKTWTQNPGPELIWIRRGD